MSACGGGRGCRASSVPPDDPVLVGSLLHPDLGVGGFEGNRGVVVLSLQSLAEARGTSCQAGGIKRHSTSCLFLQRFVESEKEF